VQRSDSPRLGATIRGRLRVGGQRRPTLLAHTGASSHQRGRV